MTVSAGIGFAQTMERGPVWTIPFGRCYHFFELSPKTDLSPDEVGQATQLALTYGTVR